MKRPRMSRLLAAALTAVALLAAVPGAGAYSVTHSTITSTSDSRLTTIRTLMDRQTFSSATAKTKAINGANYLISESKYAAIGGSTFPYPNSGGYTKSVKDGTYTVTVNAAGCYAYSKYASYVAYGAFGSRLYPKDSSGTNITATSGLTEGIVKDFLLTYAQAGEHIRLDSTHSMTFLAGDSSGFYYMEYPNDSSPKIRLCYATYANFTSAVKKEGAALWLYNANTKTNSGSSSTATDPGTTTPATGQVTMTRPTEAAYVAKEQVTDTNAVLVNAVKKPAGVKVTRMGVRIYSGELGNTVLLKEYSEAVSNVAGSTTSFHAWFDLNKEVGLTLTPGTLYYYSFFGVFDGEEKGGFTYSFQTTGTAPTPTPTPTPEPSQESEVYTVTFYLNPEGTRTVQRSIAYMEVVGAMPAAETSAGYRHDGYRLDNGVEIPEDSIYLWESDIELYPYYTPITGAGAGGTYAVHLYNVYNMSSLGDFTVDNGDIWDLPTPTMTGYTFVGWFDGRGRQYKTGETVALTEDITLKARFEKGTAVTGSEKVITLQIGSPYMTVDGVRQPIDEQGTVPIARNNRTLLPVRAVIEAMGGTVGWDGYFQVVSLTMEGRTLYLQLGSAVAWDSEHDVFELDCAPIAENGRTLLPIRFVAEYFGATVDYLPETQTVEIRK
jgi:uncharacterized repeat protein (TIGR02543 family)